MSADSGAPAMTPEAATAERASLMADPAFCKAAMNPKGPEWARLGELAATIAGGIDAAADADAAEALALQGHKPKTEPGGDDEEGDDGEEALAFLNAVPDSPAGYKLATDHARSLGLAVDPAVEIELRQSLHASMVSNTLASTIYFAAITAANQPPTPAEIQTQYQTSEHALRKEWGDQFDARLAVANAEGRRIYESLPKSVTHGLSYADWCASTGLGNNRVVISALFNQARPRDRKR